MLFIGIILGMLIAGLLAEVSERIGAVVVCGEMEAQKYVG
jgi:hypothetical protein